MNPRPSALLTFLLLLIACSSAGAAEDHTLVVANQGDGTVAFVDLNSFQVIDTIELGNGPHELAADPSSGTVFVSMYGRQVSNDEIAVIAGRDRKVVRRLSLAPHERPHGIIWRDGSIFATLERSGLVVRVSDEGAITWSGKTEGELGHMVAVSSDGRTVYTGNMKTNDVSVIRVGEDAASMRIPVGKGPEGIALSPDDAELWVAHRMGGGLSVIDTASGEVVATPGDGIFSARLSFSPDGRKVVAYDMPTRNVVVFDRQSRKEIGRYQPQEGTPVNGLISADSQHAWIIRYQPDAIFELDLETLEEGRFVETGSMPDGMAVISSEAPLASPGN